MKFLYIIFFCSSLLFSMQKQIILGTYTVESNGLAAVKIVKQQISNDKKLRTIMKKNSLQVMHTTVNNYTVVSVNIFTSYLDLLSTMEELKKYYGDAFVLPYPTKGFLNKESIGELKEKAQKELKLQEQMSEEKMSEETVRDEKSQEKEELQRKKLEVFYSKQRQREEQRLRKLEKKRILMKKSVQVSSVESTSFSIKNYYLLGALAFLVLLTGGVIIYKKIFKISEEEYR